MEPCLPAVFFCGCHERLPWLSFFCRTRNSCLKTSFEVAVFCIPTVYKWDISLILESARTFCTRRYMLHGSTSLIPCSKTNVPQHDRKLANTALSLLKCIKGERHLSSLEGKGKILVVIIFLIGCLKSTRL